MSNADSRQKCILLAADEAYIIKTAKELANEGYRIITAFSEVEAIEKVNNTDEKIDLILISTDLINNPDGTKASQEILKDKDIPVVFLLSHIEKAIIDKIEKITAYGYVLKNADIIVLNSSIKMALKLYKAQEEVKKNEKSIHESEEKYRVLVENIADVIYTVDNKGFFKYISPVIDYLYGFKKDDMIGKNFINYIYEEDQPKVIETFGHILQGKIEPSEFRVLDKDGKMMYIRVSSHLIEKGEEKNNVIGIMTDITAQKLAEEKLKTALQQTHDIIEFLPDPTFVIDENKKVVAWNKAIEQLTGIKKKEVIGQGDYIYSLIFYNERRPILIDLVGISDTEIEVKYKVIKRDGKRIYTEIFLPLLYEGKGAYLGCTAAPLFDVSGNRIGAIEVIHEITAYKQSEKKLKSALQQMHDIIEFLPDPTFVIDQDKKVVAWNKAIEQLTDIKKENILGKGNFEYSIPFYDERRPILIDLTYLSSEEIEKEYEYLKLIDNTIYAEVFIPNFKQEKGIYLWGAASPLFDVSGNKIGAIEVIRDITEHKLSEQKLKKSIKEKEILMREIQHRIKNNLNIVSSLLQLEKDSVQDDHSQSIFQNAIMRIHAISAIYEQLKMTSSHNKIDLKIYIQQTAELLVNTYSIYSGKIKLKLNIEQTDIDMSIAVQLGLILNELLSNALKFAYPPATDGELKIDLNDNGKTIILTVSDNGIGMNENIHVYLKKGLGLQLVKTLTNQIGGKFTLESYLGKGTSAKVMFDK